MASERLYRTIDEDLFFKLGFIVKSSSYYFGDDKNNVLIEKQLSGSDDPNNKVLEDEDCGWDPVKDPVHLTFDAVIAHPNVLFGENGICYEDTVIGVGLEWRSEKGRVKNCAYLGHLDSSSNQVALKGSGIVLNDFSNNVIFQLIFFIEKPGTKKENQFFGNEKGLVIGEMPFYKLFVTGTGSLFPITLAHDSNGPLWWVRTNFTDVCLDEFSDDNLAIVLNACNKNYHFIEENSPDFNISLLCQVLGAALATLIMEIRDKQSDNVINLDEKGEKGSIQRALVYLKSPVGIDVNADPSELAKQTQSFFERKIG